MHRPRTRFRLPARYGLLAVLAVSGTLPAPARADCVVPPRTPTSDFLLSDSGWAIHRPTGLMWARCGLGATYQPANNSCGTYTRNSWQVVLDSVQALNAGAGYAGFNDWRLPTVKELASIASPCEIGVPAINTEAFPLPATLAQPTFWTSTPVLSPSTQPAYAYTVEFGGAAVIELRIEALHYARLVRDATGEP